MFSYHQIKGFEYVILEESFVSEILENPNEIKFTMELYIKETAPTHLKPDDRRFYRDAEIIFSNVVKIEWLKKTLTPYNSGEGEVDYGNIDELYLKKDFYHITGDWGAIKIKSSEPRIKYL